MPDADTDTDTAAASTLSAATLRIDLGAVVANWRALLARGQGAAGCAAVVKADAYGLGAARVAHALHAAGCRTFFVALLDEALALREALPPDARIVVLHGVLPGDDGECARAGLVPVLNSAEQVGRWRATARRLGRRLPAALQVDTGMARLGLPLDDARSLQASDLEGIELRLLMSHLVSAEEPDDPISERQRHRFAALLRRWPGVPASLANSSGIFLGTPWHFDLLRPGAALYGVAPTVGRANPMRPVVRLQAPLIQWRDVRAGEGVGYNHTWASARATRVGTVAVGYADGILRRLSNRAQVRLAGRRVPIVGRVSMDTITLDVGDVPADDLAPGAAVDLLDDEHDVNALATEAGTNAYEILTRLGTRFRREYLVP